MYALTTGVILVLMVGVDNSLMDFLFFSDVFILHHNPTFENR